MPAWLDALLDRLSDDPAWSYGDGPQAAEPTALAGLALAGHGRAAAAERALGWLADNQQADGSLGITARETEPRWPTALAALAWSRGAGRLPRARADRFAQPLARAVAWLVESKGLAHAKRAEVGHDSTLEGWPWVAGTHSWAEPTAWGLLALQAAGYGQHPRARGARRLLLDRLLPAGGCNYGNTIVLGQALRPHVQPTGLVVLALAGPGTPTGRLAASLDYLQRELTAETAAASLAAGLLGLAAYGRSGPLALDWLEAAARRIDHNRSALKRAWIALAALGPRSPLVA